MKAGTVAGADLADRYRAELARTFVLKDHRSCGGRLTSCCPSGCSSATR